MSLERPSAIVAGCPAPPALVKKGSANGFLGPFTSPNAR